VAPGNSRFSCGNFLEKGGLVLSRAAKTSECGVKQRSLSGKEEAASGRRLAEQGAKKLTAPEILFLL
jgi:hypothetical protein